MELKVGAKRNFSLFPNKHFEIKEILINPKVEMWWTWDSGICPHCKRKIERQIKHVFYRIEILSDIEIKDENLTVDNIVLLGDTLDNRRMLLSKDKYKEVFNKSENFKKFEKEVI